MPRAWLAGLFLLALAARLPGLARSLWYDELFTLAHFAGSPAAALGRQVEANNHPLASLLAWAAGLVAQGEAGLRAPFLLLGAAAVPALAWAVGRSLGPTAGRAAGALAALAPLHVAFAQQVRGYAGLLLCASLLVGLVPRALRGGAPRRVEVALAACAALGAWSHATLLLPLLGWTALAALAPRLGLAPPAGRAAALRGLLAGSLGGLVLLAPVTDDLFKHARRALRPLDRAAAGPFDPGRLSPADLLDLLGGADARASALGLALALLLLGLAARGLLRAPGPERAAWLVPPLAALALVAGGAPAYARLALFALPALLALAAAGAVGLPRRCAADPFRGGTHRRWGTLALAACVALGAPRVAGQAREELQDLRGAARLARAQVGPGGLVLGAGVGGALLRAYDPDAAPDERWAWLEAALGQDAPVAVVVPFPAATPPAARARLEARAAVVLAPGRVSPVAVWLAR